jgi:hypothetical protein
MPAERAAEIESFLAANGWGAAKRTPITGDASTRRYIRLAQGGRKAILMDQPQNAEAPAAPAGATPEDRRALGYNAVARLAGADVARFVAAANYLRGCGLSAPEIFAADPAQGFAIIEDLGDALYSDVANAKNEQDLYKAAAEVLATLHARTAPQHLPPDKELHPYDEVALLAEIDLLTDWFMPVALGRPATTDEVAEHRALWRLVLREALTAPAVFVHRDYHARKPQARSRAPAPTTSSRWSRTHGAMWRPKSQTRRRGTISRRCARKEAQSTSAAIAARWPSWRRSATPRSQAYSHGCTSAMASRAIWATCRASGDISIATWMIPRSAD